jgi:hypothetical protein
MPLAAVAGPRGPAAAGGGRGHVDQEAGTALCEEPGWADGSSSGEALSGVAQLDRYGHSMQGDVGRAELAAILAEAVGLLRAAHAGQSGLWPLLAAGHHRADHAEVALDAANCSSGHWKHLSGKELSIRSWISVDVIAI